MLYAAKCYWPGVTETEVEQAAVRAIDACRRAGGDAAYLGSLLFCDDDLVLCLFDAASRLATKRVSEDAGMPCERVMDSIWLAPDPHPLKGPMT